MNEISFDSSVSQTCFILTHLGNQFLKSTLEFKDFYKVSRLILIVSDKILLGSNLTEILFLKEAGFVE